MTTNAVIDVCIGLILMYLLLSLLCTVANEFISTLLKLRAKSLEAGIQQIIDNETLRAAFYDHGLIAGTKGVSTVHRVKPKSGHPSYLSGRTFAMALIGSLDPTKPLPHFDDVEGAVKNLPDSNVRDALLANLLTADKDLTTFRNNVANWFDDAMDRLGGAYKRRLKLVSFIVGFAIALALNADTIKVGNALWHDSSLRAQMVKAAVEISASRAPGTKPLTAQQIRDTEAKLRPLPIGWSSGVLDWHQLRPLFPGHFLLKIGGILLTAFALSLGAPFWFDLLSKFIRLRGAGDKPARTQKISDAGAGT